MITHIETDRLLLRDLVPADVDGLFELDSDPVVHQYLGNKPISSKEEAAGIIDFIRRQYTDQGIGRWAVINKHNGEFIGWAGLKLVTTTINNHVNYYDIGYRLIPRYWGLGMATEATKATVHYAFSKMKLQEIYGMADCNNLASDRVLRKAGLKLIESFDYEGVTHNWYRLTSIEWNNPDKALKESVNP